MAELLPDTNSRDSMWRWWPCFIGGFCAPILAHLFVKWIPPSMAVGLAFLAMWVIVGIVFTMSPPTRRWSFVRWAAGGVLGALAVGVVAWIVRA
jgi:hypothetical protein